MTLTQLSSLTYPFSSFFSLSGWLPITYHSGLPIRVGLSLYLDLFFFFVILAFLLSLLISVCKWNSGKTVIEQSGKGPSPTCMRSSNTHGVYPNNILQHLHPLHTRLVPPHMQHSLTFLAQSRLSPAYISRTHYTKILTQKY